MGGTNDVRLAFAMAALFVVFIEFRAVRHLSGDTFGTLDERKSPIICRFYQEAKEHEEKESEIKSN